MRNWTPQQIQVIKDKYAETQTVYIAQELGLDTVVVYRKAHQLGLRKSQAFLKSEASGRLNPLSVLGQKTRFKPGQIPPNKGKKQQDYMAPEAIERTAKTRFKKGNVPANHKEIGTERLSKDGYFEIKTAKGYLLKHRVIWAENFGPIPKNMIVGFKDNNKTNLEVSNLELLTRQQNMLRNSIQRFPSEIIATIKIVSKLNKKLKNHGDKK